MMQYEYMNAIEIINPLKNLKVRLVISKTSKTSKLLWWKQIRHGLYY